MSERAATQTKTVKPIATPAVSSLDQRAAINSTSLLDAPPAAQAVLREAGQPLDAATRAFMEPRFGHDFSGVRVHADSGAHAAADAVHARAYAVGNDVVFGPGQYAQHSVTGQRLLAHELTHIVQQSGHGSIGSAALLEMEAERLADHITIWRSAPVQLAGSRGALQRAPKTDDEQIDSIVKAAAKARKATNQTDTMIYASQVVYELIARYLPTFSGRISAVGFDPAIKRIGAQASKSGKDIAITAGKGFIDDLVDARQLRPLAAELEKELVGTGVKPTAEEEPAIDTVKTAATSVAGVETKGITFKQSDIQDVAGRNYWEEKIGSKYFMIDVNSTGQRFKSNPEERDAAFAVLWKVQPAKLTAATTKLVTIPTRGNDPSGKPTLPLMYQFTFKPVTKDTDNKPSVAFEFIGEGSAATVTAAAQPDKDYSPSSHGLSFSGFPTNNIQDYWDTHEAEHRQLFNWIENLSPATFDQVVTTSTGKPPKTTSFKVKGARNKSSVTGLSIARLGAIDPQNEAAPADYRAKTDAGDFALEKEQSKSKDQLGSVKVPRDITAREAAAVKYVIAAYFKQGTRNMEVDARVPSPDTTGDIFYTFRFLPNNDVEAIRVGEPKQGTRLDVSRLDAGRSAEFLQLYKANDAKGLATFIKQRYPGVTVTGTTVTELRVALNKEIQAKANSVAWFKDIYGVTILDSTAAEDRLKKIHKLKTAQTVDLKNFSSDELLVLEATLETFSLAMLKRLKDIQLARQNIAIEQKGKTLGPTKERSGLTLTNGTETTIIIFDQAAINEGALFAGGRLGALPSTSLTIAHEFGHAIGDQADIQKKFNQFVASKKIKPITGYAASGPNTEAFPEAFALFNTDPEWMRANQPELYNWFDELSRTGQAPNP